MKSGSSRFRLAELSERFDLELSGDAEHVIDGVGTLAAAKPSQLSFLSNRGYREQLQSTRAGAVILAPADAEDCPVNALVSEQPYVSYARVAALFDPRSALSPGIHPSAVVDASSDVATDAHIGANAVIGPGVTVAGGASIGAGTVVGDGSHIGAGSRLSANVTVAEGVQIGQRVIIHSGAVIGADGFGLAFAGHGWEKVPQLGSVRIGDDCEIGANTTIDRGAIEDTVLEEDVRIDNQVQIAHNVFIGAHTAIAGCAAIAGSTRVGRNCLLGGRCSILGHLVVADRVTIGHCCVINCSIEEAGSTWAGTMHGMPISKWQRLSAHLRKLDETVRRLRRLERSVKPNGKRNRSNNE
jgi:UDP-3-O-[3-hydroxymyristoyl] glucosamine N-acyltransferase